MTKWLRNLAICLCIGALGATPPPKELVADGIKVTVGKAIPIVSPIRLHDLALYECRTTETNEEQTLITGLLTSGLPTHAFNVSITFYVSSRPVYRIRDKNVPIFHEHTITVRCPAPQRPTRFVGRVQRLPQTAMLFYKIDYYPATVNDEVD